MKKVSADSMKISFTHILAFVLVPVSAALLSGCSDAPAAPFRLNMQGRDVEQMVADVQESAKEDEEKPAVDPRQPMVDILTASFGTPDKPYVFKETGLDIRKLRLAAGPTGKDEKGMPRGLYRQHCVHCHGISGDGAGPTAAFLNPQPRDYRQGKFKFKSTERADKPTDADLLRILDDGIPGTAMPSFRLLPQQEKDALVEYVKYLSIRGEVELSLGLTLYEGDEVTANRGALLEEHIMPVVESWTAAAEKIVQIPDRPTIETPEQLAESIKLGKELFLGKRAQCVQCHGPTALGDGSDKALFDDWNKDKQDFAEIDTRAATVLDGLSGDELQGQLENLERDRKLARSWLLPKMQIQPRNLRAGIYRFGRRPADVYMRIHAGINGTPMPGGGPSGGNPATLKPEEIWHIVDYVLSLPYESLSVEKHEELTAQRTRN